MKPQRTSLPTSKQLFVKIIAGLLIGVVILNLFWFVTHRISLELFWVVIVVCAIAAWFGIPFLRNSN